MGFSRRVSFICGGVVFVCEKFHILYKDVRGTVVLQPKRMRKQEVIDAMTARDLPTDDK